MRKSVLLSASAIALACLASASPLLAQANTGTPGAWTVVWTGLGGGSATAVDVVGQPSVWPNLPNSSWISTNPSASLSGGQGNNAETVEYAWTQDFAATSVGQVQVTVWTDNFFHSFTMNGATTLVSPIAPGRGDFTQPVPRTFTITTMDDPHNILTFNTAGDGQTDGINASFSSVPEPSSIALLGTGLVGLVPMIKRRRKA